MKLNKYFKITFLAGVLFYFSKLILSSLLSLVGGCSDWYAPLKFYTVACHPNPWSISTPSSINYLNLWLNILYWFAISTLIFYVIRNISKVWLRVLILVIITCVALVLTVVLILLSKNIHFYHF